MLCTNQKDDILSDRELVIQKLSKRYDYEECYEDGRLVLKKQNLKLVEIKDTPRDKEDYIKIMIDYVHYINDHYFSVDIHKVDFEECFYQEIIKDKDKKKIPLFLAYINNNLIGTTGVSKYFEYNSNNTIEMFYEVSNRFPILKQKNGNIGMAGMSLFFMSYLYALRIKDAYFMFLTSKQNNSLFLHLINSDLYYFNFINKPYAIKEPFYSNPETLFFYFDKGFSKEKYNDLISVYMEKFFSH